MPQYPYKPAEIQIICPHGGLYYYEKPMDVSSNTRVLHKAKFDIGVFFSGDEEILTPPSERDAKRLDQLYFHPVPQSETVPSFMVYLIAVLTYPPHNFVRDLRVWDRAPDTGGVFPDGYIAWFITDTVEDDRRPWMHTDWNIGMTPDVMWHAGVLTDHTLALVIAGGASEFSERYYHRELFFCYEEA